MVQPYLALLRGVNVGGNNIISMTALRDALAAAGLENVQTYIQSGNVLFQSPEKDTVRLATLIQKVISKHFNTQVEVVVFSRQHWQRIIAAAPGTWGKDPAWKHNLLVLLPPFDMDDVVASIGTLKPDIESLVAGEGVLYQNVSLQMFGRATTGKLASNPAYKRMTIRNYNTATKLLERLEAY
jgi:uncharacterized protein (DUF1697 family)